jgi:hypothetical protein
MSGGCHSGRHHPRGACRQYLSVALPNLCNFAQERERERERKTSWKWGMIGLGKGQPRGHLTRLKLTTIVTIKERSPRIRLTPLSDRLESCRKQQRCGGA